MTTYQKATARSRDQQDGVERHVWGTKEYVSGNGSIIRVRGTDTEDYEAPVINVGYGFNLADDSDAEVHLFSMGSDTDMKYALANIPHASQREWAVGTGGIQHPTDGNRAIEFNGNEVWLKDGTFKVGHNKEVEITVSGGQTTITVNKLVINADVEINGAVLTHNGVNVGFDHVHGGVDPGGSDTAVPH